MSSTLSPHDCQIHHEGLQRERPIRRATACPALKYKSRFYLDSLDDVTLEKSDIIKNVTSAGLMLFDDYSTYREACLTSFERKPPHFNLSKDLYYLS